MCDNGSVECVVSAVGANNGTVANNCATSSTNGLLVEAINPVVHMASSLSAPSMQLQIQQVQPQQQQNEMVSAHDLAMENHWLREKLKEITADRDRLLCEVANLRLELDMAELKRLPEDR